MALIRTGFSLLLASYSIILGNSTPLHVPNAMAQKTRQSTWFCTAQLMTRFNRICGPANIVRPKTPLELPAADQGIDFCLTRNVATLWQAWLHEQRANFGVTTVEMIISKTKLRSVKEVTSVLHMLSFQCILTIWHWHFMWQASRPFLLSADNMLSHGHVYE